jgi:hypothetical protein
MARLRDVLSDVYYATFTDKGRASGGRPEARVMGPEQRRVRDDLAHPVQQLPGNPDVPFSRDAAAMIHMLATGVTNDNEGDMSRIEKQWGVPTWEEQSAYDMKNEAYRMQQLQADPDMYSLSAGGDPVMGPRPRPAGLGLVSPQYMTNEFGTIYNHNGHYIRVKPDEYVVDGPNGQPVVLKRQ